MRQHHVQEMSAWTPAPLPRVDLRFWKGLAVGVPIGVALWTVILLWVF